MLSASQFKIISRQPGRNGGWGVNPDVMSLPGEVVHHKTSVDIPRSIISSMSFPWETLGVYIQIYIYGGRGLLLE